MASKRISKLPPLRPPSECLLSCTIAASKFVQSWPGSASPKLLDYALLVQISKPAWSQPPSAPPNSPHHGVQLFLQTRTIMVCKFVQSWPPSASPNSLDYGRQVHISKPARSWPPSGSSTSLNHGLGVYLWVHSIVIFRHTSNCSQALPAASPDIPCVDGSLYRYIDENTNWIHEFLKSLNNY